MSLQSRRSLFHCEHKEYETQAIAHIPQTAGIVYNAYAVQNGVQTIPPILPDQDHSNGFIGNVQTSILLTIKPLFGMPKIEEFGGEAYHFSPILLSRLLVVLEDEDLFSPNTPKRLFQTCPGSWLASIGFQIPVFW